MERRGALSPRRRFINTELGKQIDCVLYIPLFIALNYCIIISIVLIFGCLLHLPHTSVYYWCELFVEFTTIGAHRGARGSFDSSTMGLKEDIERFTGSNDYGLWKVKMRAALIQNKG